MTYKEEALNVISDLPDSVEFEEIIYKLYVVEQIRRGQEDVKAGKVTSVDNLEKESVSW